MNDGKQNMHGLPALGTQKVRADGKARVCCLSQARAVEVLASAAHLCKVASGIRRSNASAREVVEK